jgi:hypothetical protein
MTDTARNDVWAQRTAYEHFVGRDGSIRLIARAGAVCGTG